MSFLFSLGSGPGSGLSSFNLPFGLCEFFPFEDEETLSIVSTGPSWAVAAVDKKNHRVVLIISRQGDIRWATLGNKHFKGPRDVAYHEKLQCLVVSDSQLHRLVFISPYNGEALGFFSGTGSDAIDSPHGVGVLSGSGCVVVADCPKDRISILEVAKEGSYKVVRHIGNGRGNGPQQFHNPHCVAVLDHDVIAVTDYRNHRVVLVTGEGEFLRTLLEQDGLLKFPVGICPTPMGIAVVDSNHHRVVLVDTTTGDIKGVLGMGPGSSVNELNFPAGVHYLTRAQMLVVSDHNNHRLSFMALEKNWPHICFV